MKSKQTVIWLIQANQTTPIILEYLKTFQTRVERYLDLVFWTPESSKQELKKQTYLDPVIYKTLTQSASVSEEAYHAKRQTLGQQSFSQGLLISDTLLHDDLGGGSTQMTRMMIEPPENTCGLIMQIPSPLGSSAIEENNYHAAILWARQYQIPVLGYELLPLDTQWSLAPSMVDGVITRYEESREHLLQELNHKNIWQLPSYEASMFSSAATSYHLNGVRASYHYRNQYTLPANRAVLYIPHNVAMIYEYQQLIKILGPMGSDLHLMFSVGRDQIRGSYSHEQMIEIVCKNELSRFASYSFHDVNSPWEMMMADAVVSCSSGLNTMIAERDIPCIIYAPNLPEMERGNKQRLATPEQLQAKIKKQITLHQNKYELADILMILASSRKKNG